MKRRDLPFSLLVLFLALTPEPCAHLGPSLSGRIQLQAGRDAGPVGMSEGPGALSERGGWGDARLGMRCGHWCQWELNGSLRERRGWGSLLQRVPPAGLGPQALGRRIGAAVVPCPLSCRLFALPVLYVPGQIYYEHAVVVLCVVPVQFREELYKLSVRLASLLPQRRGWQASCLWPQLTLFADVSNR